MEERESESRTRGEVGVRGDEEVGEGEEVEGRGGGEEEEGLERGEMWMLR
jgi:hypothetical protein